MVCLITAWSLATTLPDIALPWHPLSSYGLFHKDGLVTNVPPNGPAAEAGIRIGDRIDLSAMPMDERRHLYGAVYANSALPGQPLTLALERGGRERVVTLRSAVLHRTPADNFTDIVLVLSQCAIVLIATGLVLFRPGVMTWAFYVFSLGDTGLSTLLNAYLPAPLFVAQFGIAYLLGGVRAAAFAVFALRFPRDAVSGRRRALEAALVPVATALGAFALFAAIAPLLWGRGTGRIDAGVAVVDFCVYTLGVAAFVSTYAKAASGDRQRIKWILAGLVAGFGGAIGFDVIRWLVPGAVSIPLYNVMYSLNVLLPIALAYAVVRHRVIDVTFVISRAVVYATLTAAIVAAIALVHWFFARYFSSAGLGTAADIAIAVALGFWFNAFHHRIDTIVDSVFFRRRHEAEMRLARLARAFPHVSTIDGIAEGLVDQPADALDLASAALFLRRGKQFVRIRSVGWHDSELHAVGAGDFVIAQLASERSAIRVHDLGWHAKNVPNGDAAPVLALPFCVRRDLHAFALYGAHVRGEDLDPDEIAAIVELALAASSAFDHIEAETLRRKADDAQRRLDALVPPAPAAGESPLEPLRLPALSPRDVPVEGTKSRRALLTRVLACVLAAFTIGTCLPDVVRPWIPVGTANVSIDNDDYVTAVRAGSGANAGPAVHDRLDTSDLTTRLVWGWGAADVSNVPNQKIPVTYIHNGTKHSVLLQTAAQVQSPADAAFGFVSSIVGIFMILTGLVLVLLRPSLMTSGFFAYALALNPATTVRFVASLPLAGIVGYTAWILALFFAGNIGLAIFAVRFPNDRLSRTGRILLWALAAAFVPLGLAYAYYVAVFPLYGITGGSTFSAITYAMSIVAYVVSMAGFLDTYLRATREDRQRIKWVIVGFAFGIAGLTTGFILSDVSLSALSIPVWAAGGANLLAVMIPLTVGYAVIHYRVVDVRFALSRALVLGAITAISIVLFSVIDWFFGRELSASRLGILVEVAAAITLGFWLNGIHEKIDAFLDIVLFRARHNADEQLERVRRGLPFASTSRAIDDAVVREPWEALQLASAAVFVRAESGAYVRRFEIGWGEGTSRILDADDAVLLQIQGTAAPLRLARASASHGIFPQGSSRPVLAVPMLVRNKLLGVAFYGPHASGAELDADEVKTIERLVQSAAAANDHLEAEALRAKIEDLSRALAAAGLAV